MNYVKLFFKNYVNFSGRARRKEYWIPTLFCNVVMAILTTILYAGLISAYVTGTNDKGPLVMIAMALITIFSLAVFLPMMSVLFRRLHDIGKSGWWIFISAVPVIGGIIMLVFLFTDSAPGPNKWGPNPKGM